MPIPDEVLAAPYLPLNAAKSVNLMGYSSVVKDKGKRREGRLTDDTDADLIAEVYKNDVKFRISPRYKKPIVREPNPRGVITRFTKESQRRLQFTVRNTADQWKVFLTLTYPEAYPASGPETKKHLAAFLAYLRRRKIAYLWILEFQRRGAPHYHFILSGYIDKDEVAQRWYEIVGSEDPRHRAAGTRIEGVKNHGEVGSYVYSYMSKLAQKIVPKKFHNVGRFWGSSRLLKKVVYTKTGIYKDAAKTLRVYRRWFQSHTKQDFGFKWKWKGFGFVLTDGAPMFRSLSRQALMIDEGRDVWKEWDGKPKLRAQFLTLEDRMRNEGQLKLDGTTEFKYPDLQMPTERKCWARKTTDLVCDKNSVAVYRLAGTDKELSVCEDHEREIKADGAWDLVERWINTTDGTGKSVGKAPGEARCSRCWNKHPLDQRSPHCPGAEYH